ncbi:hypothetical protein ACXWR7_13300, partial [Streptococcus pyogenes]
SPPASLWVCCTCLPLSSPFLFLFFLFPPFPSLSPSLLSPPSSPFPPPLPSPPLPPPPSVRSSLLSIPFLLPFFPFPFF